MYSCKLCNYSTDVKFCYNKHTSTKKHKVNESLNHTQFIPNSYLDDIYKSNYVCSYCNNYFSSSASLSRHKHSCIEKTKLINEYNDKLKLKDDIINELYNVINQKDFDKQAIIDNKDEVISILKSEVAHLKSIVNNTGSIVKTSVSTMAYVIKNFKDAPALEMINDYSKLHNEQDNNSFIEELIHQYDHQKLDMYIGNFIVKTYKKEDPSKQSIWNSDTNRLTYLIRELLNNKVDWKVDKKGIKTKQFIIEPILEYIDDQIRNYIQNFTIDYETISTKDAEKKMMKIKSATEIIKQTEDKVLCEQILKYIAPYFYLNKTDENNIEL
jgi:hypothetical protein